MRVSPSQADLKSLYFTWLFDVMCQNCASILNKPIKSDVDNIIPSSYHHIMISHITYMHHAYINNEYVRIVYSTTWHNMAQLFMLYWNPDLGPESSEGLKLAVSDSIEF